MSALVCASVHTHLLARFRTKDGRLAHLKPLCQALTGMRVSRSDGGRAATRHEPQPLSLAVHGSRSSATRPHRSSLRRSEHRPDTIREADSLEWADRLACPLHEVRGRRRYLFMLARSVRPPARGTTPLDAHCSVRRPRSCQTPSVLRADESVVCLRFGRQLLALDARLSLPH